MFKHKAFFILAVLVLTLAAIAMSCAPAAKPATTTTPPTSTPPAPTPTPSPTPPAAPPPATAAVAPPVIQTSFTADTYTSTTPAFTVMYPKGWMKREITAPVVFWAAQNDKFNSTQISIAVIDKAADFATAAKDCFDRYGLAYNTPLKIDAQKSITLADGKTPGYAVEMSGPSVRFTLYLYIVGANIGDKTVMVVTIGADKVLTWDLQKEIANTLTLK
jgi:hypothetical protein